MRARAKNRKVCAKWAQFIFIFFVTLLCYTAAANAQTNLVRNGDFSNGLSEWSYWIKPNDAAGSVDVISGECVVDIQYDDGINWHIQLKQTEINLENGEDYTLTFSARAQSARPIIIQFKDTGGTNVVYEDIDITSTMEEHSFTFTNQSPTGSNYQLLVFLGSQGVNDVIIDNIVLSGEGSEPVEIKFEAEDFTAAYDGTSSFSGTPSCQSLVNPEVDIQTTSDPAGGTCNIGWTEAGEWLEYEIDAGAGGTFDIVLRVAANAMVNNSVDVSLDGTTVGTVTAPAKGWQAFEDRTILDVDIGSGIHTLQIFMATGGVNFNYLVVRPVRPIWEFSYLVGIPKQTADYYGGFAAIVDNILNQFNTVHDRFTTAFEGRIVLSLEDFYQFDGDALSECLVPHPGHDYKIVYDGFPTGHGGWLGGDTRCIYQSWDVDYLGGLFGSYSTDGLVHEIGHSRGAIDFYALEVDAANNPINGQAYKPPLSIMYYPYGNTYWHEHTKALINHHGDNPKPTGDFFVSSLPSEVIFEVKDYQENPVADAAIEVFPVKWYTYSVTPVPVNSFSAGAGGKARMDMAVDNPYHIFDNNGQLEYEYCNLLVRISHSGDTAYAWLPLIDVQVHYFKNPVDPFILSVVLSDNLISNGDFSFGLDDWTTTKISPADATFSAAGGELFTDVIYDDGINWHIKVHQNGIALENGKSYILSFDARAQSARNIITQIKLDHSPWEGILWQSHNITETIQNYSVNWTHSTDSTTHQLLFFLGAAGENDVWLDNVVISEN